MAFFETRKFSLRAANYKCFGEEPAGFDEVLPINIIVGRNNSGKSALLDLVEQACSYTNVPPGLYHREKPAEFTVSTPLTEKELANIFRSGSSGGPIAGDHWIFGKKLIGQNGVIILGGNYGFKAVENNNLDAAVLQLFGRLQLQGLNPLNARNFHRLSADRDIVPEVDTNTMTIAPSGRGFTNVVQRLRNKANLPSRLVDADLLSGLNEVFAPDAFFQDIVVRQYDSGDWEVFLREEQKGLVPLSHSGSGIKTVLLVVGFFVCYPFIEKKPLSQFVFAFEEIENNLHPALQRRLTNFIKKRCESAGCCVLLTTHSSAVIDFLSRDAHAQILHVTHTGDVARVRRITTYVDNRGVLDDLDVRASDLLQSNSIIWVEGPSDRLYINRWLELFTAGGIREGAHYQCVFYGGRLLAHLSGEAPFEDVEPEQATKILAINRHAILLVDSDRSSAEGDVNQTKKRMVSAVDALGGLSWVTQGREIENYISPSLLERQFPGIGALAPFDKMDGLLEKYAPGMGDKFRRNKVVFAEQVLERTKRQDLDGVLDLSTRLREVATRIAEWNGIAPSW